jgi:RNA polymerase sigma-70 factor (ECF subfamily)
MPARRGYAGVRGFFLTTPDDSHDDDDAPSPVRAATALLDASKAAHEQERHRVDNALVVRVASGDTAALSSLYERFSGLLLGVGLRILGVRSEAEDLVHDVFLEVWKRAGDFDPRRGNARAWLVMRTRSRALDRKKSPRLARAVVFDDVRDPGLRMERMRVRASLSELPPDQRAVVELAYFDGLSTAEIAERVGCPVGTVKSRLSAARERVRRALGDEGGLA